ncbi:MAG: efflux RND transporter periplasmic adaptor subunit [Acidobacteriia bacterium]|nr:efflux RND transporter periplasmic adaptor subunit [Terriglobia bacterium]
MRILKNKWTIVAALLIAVALFAAFGLNRKDKTQYFIAKVERGDIREVVDATGTINAVTSVQVGSQVSGNIYKLHADFNSKVKKGQLIAEIEPSLFQGALLQAKADYENAKANVASAKANLEKAKAALAQTKADYDRTLGLTRQGVMSQQQLDLAKANYDSAVAAVSAADAQVTQAAAQVEQRKAAVSVAQTNLDHTYIYAPIDGTVVNRAIDVGQTVAASLQAPTLFTIAQDLTKMQVYTKTDESDVGQIRVGQKVWFKVDAFPRQTFNGAVSQVRMNPTTVQNVVTYDTIIDFDNPELKLFPGMTAYVTIPVASAHDVIKLPNGALRYTPDMKPDELRAVLRENGIEVGGGRRQPGRQSQTEGQPAQAPQGPAPPAQAQAQSGPPAQQPGQAQGQSRGAGMRAGQGAPGGTPGAGSTTGGGYRAGQGGELPGGGMSARQGPPTDVAIVWKQWPDKTLKPVQVRTGITDHTVTEVVQVLHGELKEGDELVIGASKSGSRPGASGPMGGRPPGR